MSKYSLSHHKKSLRNHYRQKRQQLSATKQLVYSIRLYQDIPQLLGFLKKEKALRLSVFLANDGEIDLRRLSRRLLKLGHRLYLPVIQGLNQPLRFSRQPASRLLLEKGMFDIPIPKKCRKIQAASMDAMFVPLVAFDKFKHRLGMGGGFYDRTLSEVQQVSYNLPITIGMAHDCQLSEQTLPNEKTDIKLNTIITSSRCY